MSRAKRKKGRSAWRTVLAGVLFIVGLVLIFLDPIRNFMLSGVVDGQYETARNVTAEEMEKNAQAEATFDFDAIQPVNIDDVASAAINKSRVPSIGLISVPSVGINLTIAKGTSNLNMLIGAGTLREDQVMGVGNYTLASHHIISPGGEHMLFSPLPKVKMGEKIYITDKNKVYEYVIYMNELVKPTRVDLIDDTPGENIITLITCDEKGEDRYAIRGRLAQVVEKDQVTQEMVDAFKLQSWSYN